METRIIKLDNGQDWKVTRFHAVVGDIDGGTLRYEIEQPWSEQIKDRKYNPFLFSRDVFVYPNKAGGMVEQARKRSAELWCLFFTNDPLIINYMDPEEVTLACRENEKLILTNFSDLPGIEDAMKVYNLGEFWLSYATGGSEDPLRTGRQRNG